MSSRRDRWVPRGPSLEWALLLGVFPGSSCVGTTGSEVVQFTAYAAGPADAHGDGAPYEFDSRAGYHVVLTRATLRIGALYVNRSRPTQGAQDTPCILPGVYAAQVTEGLLVNALSPVPEPFPKPAQGTADRALAAEVWLTGARIDSEDDRTVVLDIEGNAEKEGVAYPFGGVVTIGKNRQSPSSDPATPGANPLCKLRIVTPIPVDFVPSSSGSLVVRVDPRVWLDNVDFSQVELGASDVRRIPDTNSGQPASNLFAGLRAIAAYSFEWRP